MRAELDISYFIKHYSKNKKVKECDLPLFHTIDIEQLILFYNSFPEKRDVLRNYFRMSMEDLCVFNDFMNEYRARINSEAQQETYGLLLFERASTSIKNFKKIIYSINTNE